MYLFTHQIWLVSLLIAHTVAELTWENGYIYQDSLFVYRRPPVQVQNPWRQLGLTSLTSDNVFATTPSRHLLNIYIYDNLLLIHLRWIVGQIQTLIFWRCDHVVKTPFAAHSNMHSAHTFITLVW